MLVKFGLLEKVSRFKAGYQFHRNKSKKRNHAHKSLFMTTFGCVPNKARCQL